MIQPLGRRIVVKLCERETQTASGLYRTDSQPHVALAKILSCGEEVRHVKVGQTVVLNILASAQEVGEDTLILPETSCYAITG